MALRGTIKLGDTVKDSITGLQGVVVCISHWFNGCERIVVQPKKIKDGQPVETSHFDVEQVDVIGKPATRKYTNTGGPTPNVLRGQEARR